MKTFFTYLASIRYKIANDQLTRTEGFVLFILLIAAVTIGLYVFAPQVFQSKY